eukprot:gene9791-2116_t
MRVKRNESYSSYNNCWRNTLKDYGAPDGVWFSEIYRNSLPDKMNKNIELLQATMDTEIVEPLKCGKRCKKCVSYICARSGKMT